MPNSLYAVVSTSGAVLNLVEWDGVTPFNVTPNTLVPATGAAQIGGTYSNGTFTAALPAAPVVPTSITSVQLRLALAQQNLLTAVQNAVNAASAELQTYWNYETTFDRADVLLNSFATAAPLSMTSEQIDALFILAGSLQPA